MNVTSSIKKILAINLLLPILPLSNLFVKNFYILSQNEKLYLCFVIFVIFFIGFLIKFLESKKEIHLSKLYYIWVFLFFNYYTITNFAFSNFPPSLTKIDNYAFYFYLVNFLFITYLFIKFFENEVFQVLLSVFVI